MKEKNVFSEFERVINASSLSQEEKDEISRNILKMKSEKLNILITGPTGCGKSSTINALFGSDVAKVGVGVDPETMDIDKYQLGNITLWDTPGLGDGVNADRKHAEQIIKLLNETDDEGNALIDLVLVIVEAGNRELGTCYELINQVIIPNLGHDEEKRLVIAINQADMGMKGRNWDYEKSEPNEKLIEFLDEKAASIKRRVKESTGVNVNPIYYSAGYTEEDGTQCKPYNLSKLLKFLIDATPDTKRALYVDQVNTDAQMWEIDDGLENYTAETQKSVLLSLATTIPVGMELGSKVGAAIGGLFGPAGSAIGAGIGAVVGAVGGFFCGLLGI